MAAIAAAYATQYPTNGAYTFYTKNQQIVQKTMILGSVSAGDTATASVLGLSKVLSAHSGYNLGTDAVVTFGVDYANNKILVGAGPTTNDVFVTVTGTPKV